MDKIIKILAIVLWISTAIKVWFFNEDSFNLTVVTMLLILIIESHKE